MRFLKSRPLANELAFGEVDMQPLCLIFVCLFVSLCCAEFILSCCWRLCDATTDQMELFLQGKEKAILEENEEQELQSPATGQNLFPFYSFIVVC